MNKSKIIILILILIFSAGCLSKFNSNRPVYKDRDSAKKLAIDTVNERYGKTFIFIKEVEYDINRYGIEVYEDGFPERDFIIVINNNIEVIDSYLWVLNKSKADKITNDILLKYPEVLYNNSGLESGNNDGEYDINTPFKKYIQDKSGYISMEVFILDNIDIEYQADIIHNLIKDFHKEGLSLNIFVFVVPIDKINVFNEQIKETDTSPSNFYFNIYKRFFKIKNKDWSNYEEILFDMKESIRLEEEYWANLEQ